MYIHTSRAGRCRFPTPIAVDRLSIRAKFTSMILLITAFAVGGCQRGAISQTEGSASAEQLVGYYSPRTIKILPFTKPRSFDNKSDIPSGIAVSLRPLDAMNDPVKAYGTFMFELYSYQPASSDRRGKWIQTWTQPIQNLDDQRKFWERVTSTYEFQLDWAGSPIPPQKKYVLVASFQAPGSERLFDEYVFEFRMTREDLIHAQTEESDKE